MGETYDKSPYKGQIDNILKSEGSGNDIDAHQAFTDSYGKLTDDKSRQDFLNACKDSGKIYVDNHPFPSHMTVGFKGFLSPITNVEFYDSGNPNAHTPQDRQDLGERTGLSKKVPTPLDQINKLNDKQQH